VGYLVRNEEAAGSSPAPSTNLFSNLHCFIYLNPGMLVADSGRGGHSFL